MLQLSFFTAILEVLFYAICLGLIIFWYFVCICLYFVQGLLIPKPSSGNIDSVPRQHHEDGGLETEAVDVINSAHNASYPAPGPQLEVTGTLEPGLREKPTPTPSTRSQRAHNHDISLNGSLCERYKLFTTILKEGDIGPPGTQSCALARLVFKALEKERLQTRNDADEEGSALMDRVAESMHLAYESSLASGQARVNDGFLDGAVVQEGGEEDEETGDKEADKEAENKVDKEADEGCDEDADEGVDEKVDEELDEEVDEESDKEANERSDEDADEEIDGEIHGEADEEFDEKGVEKADEKDDEKDDEEGDEEAHQDEMS